MTKELPDTSQSEWVSIPGGKVVSIQNKIKTLGSHQDRLLLGQSVCMSSIHSPHFEFYTHLWTGNAFHTDPTFGPHPGRSPRKYSRWIRPCPLAKYCSVYDSFCYPCCSPGRPLRRPFAFNSRACIFDARKRIGYNNTRQLCILSGM